MKILFLLVFPLQLLALNLPTGLTPEDQAKVLEILGLGTSSKILSDPYPLGGYSGVEVGLSVERIPVSDLGRLGNKAESQEFFTYPKIFLGKGLFYDLDVFLHFIPFNEGTGLSEFGGMLRWGFFQSDNIPANISIVIHGNSSNLSNQFTSTSIGADLITGINVSYFSIYTGVGLIEVDGRFVGGVNGVTSSGSEENTKISRLHTLIGFTLQYKPYFIAVQIDQYDTTVVSTKLGFRF